MSFIYKIIHGKKRNLKTIVGVIFIITLVGLIRFSLPEQKIKTVYASFELPALFSIQTIKVFNELKTQSVEVGKSPVYIVHFWASWCGPCREEFPSLLKAREKLPAHIHIIAISGDEDPQQAQNFVKQFDSTGTKMIYLIDQKGLALKAFGTQKIPETYIIDKDRSLIKKIAKAMDWMQRDNLGYLSAL